MAISQKTRKLLWARSGDICAFPGCTQQLTLGSSTSEAVVIGTECHIVSQRPNGPRGNCEPPGGDTDGLPNLLLLCPTHHRLVDEQPDVYPVETLIAIKDLHEWKMRESRELGQIELKGQADAVLYSGRRGFDSWYAGDAILAVSLMGDEPTRVSENTWIGAGLIFRASSPNTGVVEIGSYSEAECDVQFSIDDTELVITEFVFDLASSESLPFIEKRCDLTRLGDGVRAFRLTEPENTDPVSIEQVLHLFDQNLSSGIDPETAVLSLRGVGLTNTDSVIGAIETLLERGSLDGAAAECATSIVRELQEYRKAE